jgi:hypothetical protein
MGICPFVTRNFFSKTLTCAMGLTLSEFFGFPAFLSFSILLRYSIGFAPICFC